MAEHQQAWYRRWTWKKLVTCSLLVIMLFTASAIGWLTWQVRSSLPQLDGNLDVTGLTQQVTIERDSQGVPTISADSRVDTAFALGFLHAQDRFFQMDLLRRLSSGRLSELFGEAAIDNDTKFRKHRFKTLAAEVVKALPNSHAVVLQGYANGVNQGIRHLRGKPFEYLLLGREPTAWQSEDTILVMLSMLCDLQPMDGEPEIGLGILHERVPQEVFDFLVPRGSQWDAALDNSAYPPSPIPSAEVFSIRNPSPTNVAQAVIEPMRISNRFPFEEEYSANPEFLIGSNNWAVDAKRSKSGNAMVASDMHLGLRVPATWYQAAMNTPSIDGSIRPLVGATLPGTPLLIEGSNGTVAWGFTNSYGDYGDIIELKNVPNLPDHYVTPDGIQALQTYHETIQFPGGSREIEYEWSVWGPVVATRDGRRFVHRWIGHDHQAFDMRGMDLESATSAESAMQIANESGMPHLNIVIADSAGNIGWTICGRVPRRPTSPPLIPVDWSSSEMHWQGYLHPEEYPRLLNPTDGRVWTANNRVMGDEFLNTIGDGRYDKGARARQIRDRLLEQPSFNEQDLLAIQLDDEALFLQRWQKLLLSTCANKSAPVSKEFADSVNNWEGHASTSCVGYRLTHEFRLQVIQKVFGFETGGREALGEANADLGGFALRTGIRRYLSVGYEDAIWELLEQQPEHWLPNDYTNWDALLASAATDTENSVCANQPLSMATWGQRNTVQIKHPISRGLPVFASWLDMPTVQLPGDNNMPRVQGPAEGASQRMVVAPGQEKNGLYHQPGGQSGHPFSPFYRAGFHDWSEGNASPLLPDVTVHKLVLRPN